jgi:3-oxoacyl-[acyl-carrier-protein] synthase-3
VRSADGADPAYAEPMVTPSGSRLPALPRVGVRIAGTGSALPRRVVTNEQIATIVDTSDEWIRQRTGVRTRHICDPRDGESNLTLCVQAIRRALEAAAIPPSELDLIIAGTITQDMRCPSTACLVSAQIGAGRCAAWDLGAACSGFVYALNTAHDLIRAGSYRTVGVIGADTVSSLVDYTNRGVCILFGDAAGAVVLRATDDTTKGCIAQVIRSDGRSWPDLYMPAWMEHIPVTADRTQYRTGCLQMNGRAVFKFAVSTFQELIAETLERAGLRAEDVDMFVCHQSNARILEAARERFGIPPEKLYINIDRVGNTSAGSAALCLDELTRAGRVREGQLVMIVAFGAGLTWASSLWQL